MAADTMVHLLEALRKQEVALDVDFLREALTWVAQQLMELEVTEKTGAAHNERSAERKTYRNGYRQRDWDTRVGTIPLSIPKLREGSYFPSLLEPRRRAEQALLSVVQEAYVQGISTRKVDALVKSLGMEGISKSQVSRLCQELDAQGEAFRTRALAGEYPYLWLDATFAHVREAGKVTSQALVIAVAVNQEGVREVLGCDVGPSESGAFWESFLRELVQRGLKGVRLVISDAHAGIKEAIASILVGTSWQRCRVHLMRNLLALVPKHAQPMVSATVRTIFAQPDQAQAKAMLRQVAETLRGRFPKVAELLLSAEEEVLAYLAFPPQHWRQLHSTNPLERLNREIKRRTEAVSIFPNPAALLRLATALLEETHEEWLVGRRYFSQESMALLKAPRASPALPPEEAPAALAA